MQQTFTETAGGSALYTDYYQLTMAQGYFLAGTHARPAAYDYYFRKQPFDGGFTVFCGWADFLRYLADLAFWPEELDFLAAQGFRPEFLAYLKDFRFQGDIFAPPEGEIVFPHEPIVCVRGGLLECQLVETALLNILNFQSLIATKAARIRLSAGADKTLLEFGLRRAQGTGAMAASRAAAVGGFDGTSNVSAAFRNGLTPAGTMAHAWIQSFDDELTAFRKYAEYYPEHCVLLVDTYHTLASGVPNAIIVAKELEAKGAKLSAIRLDSGDLAYLSKHARRLLDEAGLHYVQIAATNDLDERLIKSLVEQKAPIDIFGVGTKLVTAQDCPALGGVYKLVEIDGVPKIKISENVAKISLPGLKTVYRYYDADGSFNCDGIALADEGVPARLFHPETPDLNKAVAHKASAPLLHLAVRNGEPVRPTQTVREARAYAVERLAALPDEHKRFDFPHLYKVGVSETLLKLRTELLRAAAVKTGE